MNMKRDNFQRNIRKFDQSSVEVGYKVGFGEKERAENARVYRLFFWCDRRDLNYPARIKANKTTYKLTLIIPVFKPIIENKINLKQSNEIR